MARLRYLQNKRSGTHGTISKSTEKIYFYDEGLYIGATADGALKIYADTSLTLEATTITVNGNFVYSGTDKLHLGTSSANLTLTEGTPVFQVYTNCSSSHASTTAVPSYFCANMDTAAGVGRALEAVLTVEDVKLGSWSNAIKGKIDFETSGSGSGLLSAICAEMIMPAATMGGYGNYAPLEIEFVCPLTWAGSPQSVSFMNINLAGSSTGDTTDNFDDIGYLMVINGLDDGDTHCLRNNTLKIKVDTTTWYLPLSSAQGSFTTAYPIVTTYATLGIDISSTVTGIDITDASTAGININGTTATGIIIGDGTTTGISITGASAYAIDIATTGHFRMGTFGTGIPTTDTYKNTMEIYTEPTTAFAAAGLVSGIRCRYEISTAQTNQVTICAIDARLRVKANMADGVHSGIQAIIEGSETCVLSGTSTTQCNAGSFTVELGTGFSFTGDGWVCGVAIDSATNGALSMSGTQYVALRINVGSGKEPWEIGIEMDGNAGIGIDFNDTFTGNVIQIGDATTALTTATSGLKGLYVHYEYTGTTGNISGVYSKLEVAHTGEGYSTAQAVYGVVMIDADFTGGAGHPAGTRGHLHFVTASDIDATSSVLAGAVAAMTDAGSVTFTNGVICALYADNQIANDLSGVESSIIRMANNDGGTSGILYGLDFYGPYVTNFVRLEGCTNGGMLAPSSTAGTMTYTVKCDIDGTPAYLHFYDE